MIGKLLKSKIGQIVISILLGLGLATIFRKVCKDNSCMVIKGPSPEEVKKYVYKIDSDCYKYTPYASACKEQ